MNRIILLSAVLLSMVFPGKSAAQTATLSPYSRFGPGDMAFKGYAHQQAMGGTAFADYGSGRLNFLNPATYAYDTLMIVEFGIMGERTKFSQNSVNATKDNASLSYLTFGLPLKRDRWGLSFGIIPYSSTGYEIESVRTLDSNGNYASSFKGDGGYNRYFVGTGFRIGKHFSAGINASYLFGTVNQTSRIIFDNTSFFDTRYRQENRIKDFYYEFGLHWQKALKNNYHLAIGLTGAPSLKLDTRTSVEWVTFNLLGSGIESVRDTVLNIVDRKGETTLPQYLGLGLALSKGRKWTLLADASFQDWSSYASPEKGDTLANSFRVSAGGRYTPDEKGIGYWNRISYRAGVYYHQTFLDLRNTQLNDMGVTVGAGLPLRKAYQSMLNFTVTAGQRGTLGNDLVREQYLRFQFGITFNEDWFRKRRFD